jgi:hypothetical protein
MHYRSLALDLQDLTIIVICDVRSRLGPSTTPPTILSSTRERPIIPGDLKLMNGPAYIVYGTNSVAVLPYVALVFRLVEALDFGEVIAKGVHHANLF